MEKITRQLTGEESSSDALRHPIAWLRTKPSRDAARDRLRQDLETDLRLLRDWWLKIKPRKDQDEIHWVDKVVYARELADAPLPNFAVITSSLPPRLTDYLSRRERARLAHLQKDLEKIEEIRGVLRSALEQDLALRQLPVDKPPPTFENFLRIAARLWFQAALLVEEILSRGNPL